MRGRTLLLRAAPRGRCTGARGWIPAPRSAAARRGSAWVSPRTLEPVAPRLARPALAMPVWVCPRGTCLNAHCCALTCASEAADLCSCYPWVCAGSCCDADCARRCVLLPPAQVCWAACCPCRCALWTTGFALGALLDLRVPLCYVCARQPAAERCFACRMPPDPALPDACAVATRGEQAMLPLPFYPCPVPDGVDRYEEVSSPRRCVFLLCCSSLNASLAETLLRCRTERNDRATCCAPDSAWRRADPERVWEVRSGVCARLAPPKPPGIALRRG
jgi:hypothetical protein